MIPAATLTISPLNSLLVILSSSSSNSYLFNFGIIVFSVTLVKINANKINAIIITNKLNNVEIVYLGSNILAALSVIVNKLLSVAFIITFIEYPNDDAAKAAIIPPKGFLLPYLNRSAAIGNIITNPKSPTNDIIKQINIKQNVITFFLAFFVIIVKIIFKNPVFSKTPIPIKLIINIESGAKLTKSLTA